MFRRRKSKATKPSLGHDLKATRRAGIRTAILVTVLVSGVVPAFLMLFRWGDSAIPFTEHLRQMWSVAVMTYPLTIVIAALTILRKRGVLRFGNILLTISVVIFCGSLGHALGVVGGHETANRATALRYPRPTEQVHAQWQPNYASANDSPYPFRLGQSSASGWVEPKQKSKLLLGLPAACYTFFANHYRAYGLRVFLASVLVGMFAGNAANRFLDHVPQNRRGATELAKDILATRERAA